MNKSKIVIASVLKPITEPRAFNKLALSLRETNKYHINIIGFCSKKKPTLADIRFTSIFCRSRIHPLRLLASLKFLREIFRYRPQLVIVTTYELLIPALLGKLVLQYRLIYDLQENYHQNVLLNRTSALGIKKPVAWLIRVIEKAAHPFVDHYFFAERTYRLQFPHINKFTVLENKFSAELVPLERTEQKRSTFIISGTITPVYGVEKAIKWFISLQREFPETSLTIVGHAPLLAFRQKLEKQAASHPKISMTLSQTPMPYAVVLEAVRQAEIVLMPYDTIDSIRSKIPSKLYESIALKKPILISDNPFWENIISVYPAGLALDFSKTNEAASGYKRLLSLPLYQEEPANEVRWEGEKKKLLKAVSGLIG